MTQSSSATSLLLAVAMITSSSAMAFAEYRPSGDRPDGPPPGADGAPPQLPPEAYEACAQRDEGAACKVELGQDELTGTCANDREERLFCRLDNPPAPPSGGGRPPRR